MAAQAMENWFQACATDEPFALELVGTRREQGFVLRASSEAQLTLLSKQLQAQYPQAEICPLTGRDDLLWLRAGEHAVIGEFALAKPSWMPIKTFAAKALTEPGGDPLANILAAMEIAASGERIISQLALVRAPDSWINPAMRKAVEHPLQQERDAFAASLKGDGSPSDLARGRRILAAAIGGVALVYGLRWYHERAAVPLILLGVALVLVLATLFWWQLRKREQPVYEPKLVAEKLMRSAFYVQLRVIAIGKQATSSHEALRRHLTSLETAYRQFALASANSFRLAKVTMIAAGDEQVAQLSEAAHAFARHRHRVLRVLIFWRGWSDSLCNSLELSGLFHLPQQYTDLPLVKRLAVKRLLFSPEVADAVVSRAAPQPPVVIGISSHRGHSVTVALPYQSVFAHKFLLGRSRYGKSVLVQLLVEGATQLTRDGSPQPGIFVIDPHRDLIFDLLKAIPDYRMADVLLLDFTEGRHVVGMNPLDATMGLTRDQMIASLMSCFERIWEKYWGPRMAFFLKNICLLLVTLNMKLCAQGRASEQYTLLDINPVLQYREYATLVLHQLDRSEPWHQELLAWFQHTYWTLPHNSSLRQEIILPILSKMAVFHDNVQLRRIFGQAVTTAPVHEAITGGRIVLCALSSRDMDESCVNVLGSTLINTLHYAFLRQQEVPLGARRKCAVFIDELQNFSGSSFDKLLSEDAKWGCAALFTTQSLKRLGQIKEGLQEMLLSNCEQLFAFNVSAADAKLLEGEYQDKVTAHHFLSQPPLHCYGRIAVPGFPLQFASITLARPPGWQSTFEQERHVERVQRAAHGRLMRAEEIDQRYHEHLARFLDVSVFVSWLDEQAEDIAERRARKDEEDDPADGSAPPQDDAKDNTSPDPSRATARYDVTAGPGKGGQTGRDSGQGLPGRDASENGSQGGDKPHKKSRSRRMNRLKKQAVGAPLPGLHQPDPTDQTGDPRPLSSTPAVSRFEREGRERERGS